MIPTEINLKGHKFQNQYYVSGHFDFEIEVEYEDHSKGVISRRYSEIRSLYKLLILKCPGCYIPDIPSKSIWLKINYGNQEQMNDRMEGIREFLSHIAHHKILRKNKYVINFFSKKYERLENNSSNSIKNNKISNEEKEDSDDDELNFGMENKNDSDKDDNINENQEDDDIEPLDEYIEEVNNRNKGIVSKGKKLFGNMYNYLKSYTGSSNNNEEEGEENKNNNKTNESSNIFYKKLSKEDYEFIKKKTKELGEDFEINDYNEKINRLNEGVKNIIQNFEKLLSVHEKNTHALENIVNNDNNKKNLDKNYEIKNNNIDKFDDNVDEENSNKKIINHKNNISKIRQYCVIQRGFLNKKVQESLEKIRKHQILLQGLLDIYARKKDHLNFLGKLHSQKEELEKQKQDIEDPLINNKIDDLEKKLKYEIKFINKINKDLRYEIEKYKSNQEEIYIFINSLFKEKANTVKNCIKELNKENLEEDKDDENNIKSNNSNNNKKEYIDDKKDDDF